MLGARGADAMVRAGQTRPRPLSSLPSMVLLGLLAVFTVVPLAELVAAAEPAPSEPEPARG